MKLHSRPTKRLAAFLTEHLDPRHVALSDQAASLTGRQRDWARRIADRYHLHLDDSLCEWFDAGQWRSDGTGEFRHPVASESLCDPAPECIWPGLLPPDLLPVLGDDYGDWLCLRIGPDNRVQEVVHWYHGGGDWIPWGRTLPEALAFQQIRDRLPGQPFRHADPAEPLRLTADDDPLFHWGRLFLPASSQAALDRYLKANDPDALNRLIAAFIDEGVAEIPLRAECILQALDTPLRRLNPKQAAAKGIEWNDALASWMLDSEQIPIDQHTALAERLGHDGSAARQQDAYWPQDWETAREHADAVANRRPDLAWSWNVIGWTASRQGDLPTAMHAYRQSLLASVFTEQGVRFRTQGHEPQHEKFAAAQLSRWPQPVDDRTLTDSLTRDYEQAWHSASSGQRSAEIAQFWYARSQVAEAAGDHALAYTFAYQAGWDLGLPSLLDYQDLLQRLAMLAAAANQPARSEVASTHARCFEKRFA